MTQLRLLMRKSIAIIAATLLASSAVAADNPTATVDFSGGWRLHPEGSRFLSPDRAPQDIFWGIVFDGNHVHWNFVIIPKSGPPHFHSFENSVGAGPAPLSGSEQMTRASVEVGNGTFATKTLRSLGEIKETSSTCSLSDDKKQMHCRGTAKKSDGSVVGDFDITFDRM
jgi:hypothetical protein